MNKCYSKKSGGHREMPVCVDYCSSLLPMISQAGDMAWLGSSGGCAVYYFITSWLVGLSNYLVVCLVCMILVLERDTFFCEYLFNFYFSESESGKTVKLIESVKKKIKLIMASVVKFNFTSKLKSICLFF